jgi:hypothetical protein
MDVHSTEKLHASCLAYTSQVVVIIDLGANGPRDVVDRRNQAVYIQGWESGIACIFPVPSHVTIDSDLLTERMDVSSGELPELLSMS